jgi:hypothetical protein
MVGDNMYFLGLLTAILFFLLLFLAFYIGSKVGKRPTKTIPIDDVEKQRIEQFNKHFKALFAYDVDTATRRKKVT